jgi:beta-1,4-glucosyltransferase
MNDGPASLGMHVDDMRKTDADRTDTYRIGPIRVLATTCPDAVSLLVSNFNEGKQTLVAFANTNLTNFAAANGRLAEQLDKFVVLNDGIGLSLGARMVYGRWVFPDNLNGTDFTPLLIDALPRGTRVFLYGGRPHVVREMARHLGAVGHITVAGFADGYSPRSGDDLVAEMNASGADVLLVALGNPLQEEWIATHAPRLDARLLVGVGALFDFVSGEFSRAPRVVRRLKLEWLYRLALEPRRLAKRYSWDIVKFIYVVLTPPPAKSS